MANMQWVKVAEGREVLVDLDKQPKQETGAPMIASGHLSLEERRKLQIQLGVPITDRAHLRRVLKEGGFRVLEGGEKSKKQREALREWRKAPPSERGPLPSIIKERRFTQPLT